MSEVTMINEQRMREAGLSADALRTAARADAHRWSSAPASKDLDDFWARIDAAAQQLDALSAELDALPTRWEPPPSASQTTRSVEDGIPTRSVGTRG